MTPDQFTQALSALGWKQSDFCRKVGCEKSTPSRWVNGLIEIPGWVPEYLGLLLDLKTMQAKHLDPKKGGNEDAASQSAS